MAGPRLLSYSEIETAMSCWARHAFAYTGHLTDGDALAPRMIPRVLSEGRARGAAVARWHEQGQTLMASVDAAMALRASLTQDEQEMSERGVSLPVEDRVEAEAHLMSIFQQYVANASPLGNLTRLEDEIEVPIPSRVGTRSSSRYRFRCFIDGWTVDEAGRPWLVEFKLRRRLQSAQLISTSRQLRWYAWALRKAKGIEPVGVLVDETWNTVANPARIVKAKRKGEGIDGLTVSHASDQVTTQRLYREACARYGLEPMEHTLDSLGQITWHRRTPILFRDDELEEAGQELVSAAKLIRDLDSGELTPIRHVSAMTCNGCRYRDICPNPGDDLYVDTQFERVVPKRDREKETV